MEEGKSTNSNEEKEIAEYQNSPVGSWVRGLELDLRLREFEISQLTQRNNFFMIFQGVLIAGFVQSQGTSAPIIYFMLTLLGVLISLMQIGMAGGAKYWQCRWEASTRSSELAIVEYLLNNKKLAIQTFTLNNSLLNKDELRRIEKWNSKNPNEKIIDDNGYIDEMVRKDIESSSKGCINWWVRELAILKKWSVSKIPIWVGGFLFLFWVVLFFNTFHFPWVNLCEKYNLCLSNLNFIELLPLKSEINK